MHWAARHPVVCALLVLHPACCCGTVDLPQCACFACLTLPSFGPSSPPTHEVPRAGQE
ncbi:hypothetical protein PF005_g7012 [Phytophthora fragariae]|uniref:Secreted protein n=1 Tax=Phytophthora fragariae TaxID=53985 RepID=A0A6A4DK57_9STRA|nr:hypothetical protein PF003_g39341 [Phytophthora fragariae]KAE8939602.1 hypothetical protein PF009_g10557 [Phytophthora fragariae]KAE9011858.1 hypothetical protein PF011_g9178 [Phytophthora fragariae]KAE9110930.1 hypothetical protein PF010_g10995 [Phytophthora fragariae]KAE9116299.1 hypothetical protein PF007_g9705 [Phytophthora fragariae]